jgi:SAM-dependent methyltransferase
MQTAFGRAMIDSINGPPRQFSMSCEGGPFIKMSCQDFLKTRPDENQLLNNLPDQGAVLDIGCGVGRHLAQIRRNRPAIHCCGVEKCELMLDHCRNTIDAPATFVSSLEELPSHIKFNLIILMGNGLGILGQEQHATVRLGTLVNLLSNTGKIIIETGNPFGIGYIAPNFTIKYNGTHDGPFPWGYSDKQWISTTLQNLGCEVVIHPSQAPGGMFFFAVGYRR